MFCYQPSASEEEKKSERLVLGDFLFSRVFHTHTHTAEYIRSKWYGENFLSLSLGKMKMRLGVWNGSTCVSLFPPSPYILLCSKKKEKFAFTFAEKMNMLRGMFIGDYHNVMREGHKDVFHILSHLIVD